MKAGQVCFKLLFYKNKSLKQTWPAFSYAQPGRRDERAFISYQLGPARVDVVACNHNILKVTDIFP